MSVIIKDMDKADRCADCQLLQTYQEHPFASVEMWCGVTDERIDNMQMVLPTCPIIADRKTEPCGYKMKPIEQTEPQKCDDCIWSVCNYNKVDWERAEQTEPNSSGKPNNCEDLQDWKDRMWAEAIVTEPQRNMAEDIVGSFGFNTESYRQAKAKTEPQTDCAWGKE